MGQIEEALKEAEASLEVDKSYYEVTVNVVVRGGGFVKIKVKTKAFVST